MIYVAVADLIPGLHKRTQLRDTVQQVLLILRVSARGADGRSAARIKILPQPLLRALRLSRKRERAGEEKNSATIELLSFY